MKGFIKTLLLSFLVLGLISCASKKAQEDPVIEDATAPSDQAGGDALAPDEFNDAQQEPPPEEQPQELSLEENTPEPAPQAQEPAPAPVPEPVSEPIPVPSSSQLVEIRGIQYKGNDSGGTLVIDASGPFTYSTRSNAELKQFVIEIPNSILPDRLKRPLNTKDFKGAVGSIDAYQNAGSNVSRFVLQMREGAQDPVLQMEGNTLLVAMNDTSVPTGMMDTTASNEPPTSESSGGEATPTETGDKGIMSNLTLEDFLAGNTKFYGKKVSCAFENIDTREALEFIMLDSGLNLILDDLTGVGNVNIRIREVPWDQCLVLIMKVKKLGYTRMGNVLRIAKLDDLSREEDEAIKRADARKKVEPVKVRIFPISYSQAKELEAQVKNFLTKDRGIVSSDGRTNSLIVTDTEDSLEKIARMITNLDTPPPQVLIEGKIVEATESFQKSIGINWNLSGQAISLGTNRQGTPVNMTPSVNFNPSGTTSSSSSTGFGLSLGTLDFLGDLTASLTLFEIENKVKVLSSPRVVTMNNEQAQISTTSNLPQPQITVTPTGTTTSYTQLAFKLSLDVVPQITNDASIIMKVTVNRDFAGSPVDPKDPASIPKFTRQANTRVIVKNGQTAVIGGIYQNDATEGESGVSGLRKVPVIGYLFRTQSLRKEKNELLIFLTPRIINSSTASSDGATPTTM